MTTTKTSGSTLTRTFFLAFLFSLLFSPYLSAQLNSKDIKRFTETVDKAYGINDMLVNGYPYIIPNQMINGHPYLYQNSWIKATIYIDGNKFSGKPVKYDLQKDDLVLKADFGNGRFNLVQLNKMLVDSFKIGNNLFVQSTHYSLNIEEPTYYEELYRNGVLFLRSFDKKFVSNYTELSPRGKFSDLLESRYILKNDKLHKI